MRQRLFLTAIACLLLGSCSLMTRDRDRNKPVLPPNPLQTAESLADNGRWGEAAHLLQLAIAQGLGNDDYLSALSKISQRQKSHEDKLEAELLLEETTALQKQLSILDKLVYSDPNNQQATTRQLSARDELMRKRSALSACGWQQHTRNSSLARRCLEQALAIKANTEDQQLLEQINKKNAQTIMQAVQKQQGILEKQWKNRNQDRLQLASQLFENSKFDEARKQLRLLLHEDPDNEEAKKLLSQLQARLDSYMNHLLETGDRMYREGEIEGAKALWQAAQNLDPDDVRAKEKIERADRVLKNLETLRKTKED